MYYSIEIIPNYSTLQVLFQNTLQSLSIEATIDTNGFSAVENKIRIKKTSI